jgi:hypothetical protein
MARRQSFQPPAQSISAYHQMSVLDTGNKGIQERPAEAVTLNADN